MSKPMDQLQEIAALLPLLKAAREEVSAAEKRVRTLDMRQGQDTISVSIGGLLVPLTHAPRESGWMPVVVPGRHALLAECWRVSQEHLIGCRSKVEGLEYRLRLLAQATTKENT